VRQSVAHWLAKHISSPDLVRWVVDHGAHLHPDFADRIDRELDVIADVPEALRRVWRVLISQTGLMFREASTFRLGAKNQRYRDQPWSAALRLELLADLSPCVTVSPQRFSYPASEDASVRIAQLLSIECGVRCGDERSEIAAALQARADYRAVAVDLAFDFTSQLRMALDLQASLDQASRDHDRGYIDHPSIAPHEQNDDHYGWTMLIDLVRESFDVAREDRVDLAEQLVKLWATIEYPTFRRLVMYAAGVGVMP